jgi:hypothetical protein
MKLLGLQGVLTCQSVLIFAVTPTVLLTFRDFLPLLVRSMLPLRYPLLQFLAPATPNLPGDLAEALELPMLLR